MGSGEASHLNVKQRAPDESELDTVAHAIHQMIFNPSPGYFEGGRGQVQRDDFHAGQRIPPHVQRAQYSDEHVARAATRHHNPEWAA